MPRKLAPDVWLFAVALVLLSTGIVMIYSASAIVAADRFRDPYFFLKRQVFWAALGCGALWLALRTDYRRLEKLVPWLLGLAVVLLLLVLIPGIGVSINGSRRWLRLGPLSFQPAELAKLALVLYLAAFLARKREQLDDVWHGLVPPLAVGAVLASLVLLQPDLGNAVTLLVLTVGLLFLAGARTSWLAMLAIPALPLAALAVWMAPYRMRRIFAFLDPWQDPRGSGFQIIQSWLGFGSGGLFGRGIGESKQKLFYLPEAHTDFIFSIVGEELGFVGAVTVVALFAVLVWRGLRIGLRAQEPFGAYLALGITVLVATQTLVNLGVVTGLLPTKGLPLPFLSFGGSALLVTMAATGVLLNISQDARV
ncbi:MAG: putative lipid II flippase FtsW [Candidatus Rokubacteria bacterium]|nr:putative lipid II flippase FtsW [Candidatus Rokubacteria bacterium]